ncbi:MAG: 30S ribosomal protein S27ae [Candidatus Lokiarchaeota archaeon]|nr:30S ribosomal protein S27ae [Candidatus Lokiarchaeota archaeon]
MTKSSKNMSKYYKIEGNKLVRTNRACNKCGPSVFMAEHYDRWACGSCGYTIFKRKGKKATSEAPSSRKRSPRKRQKST